MAKVTITFDIADADAASSAVIACEDALGENVDNFEWDVED